MKPSMRKYRLHVHKLFHAGTDVFERHTVHHPFICEQCASVPMIYSRSMAVVKF